MAMLPMLLSRFMGAGAVSMDRFTRRAVHKMRWLGSKWLASISKPKQAQNMAIIRVRAAKVATSVPIIWVGPAQSLLEAPTTPLTINREYSRAECK